MPFATSSDALVTRSDGLQPSSFVLQVVRPEATKCPLLLAAMPLLLGAMPSNLLAFCY